MRIKIDELSRLYEDIFMRVVRGWLCCGLPQKEWRRWRKKTFDEEAEMESCGWTFWS